MRSATFSRGGERDPRPLGVWILTACAAIFAGLLPLIGSLAAVFLFREELGMSTPLMLVTAVLSLAIFGSAFATWQGNDTARLALVALVVLFYLLLAITNFYNATNDFLAADVQRKSAMTGIRSLLWIPLYLWYFLRAKTVAWFQPY